MSVTFQSTTPATPPSGTVIETEDQGAGLLRQVVKIGNTVAVTVSSMPLPTGASTAANQASEIALLTTIASGVPVTQGTSPWVISAASLPLPTGAATSAAQTTGNTSLSSIDGKTPALGQALAAASVPIVLTAAQITTLTPLTSVTVTQGTASNLNATVVGTGTFAVQATLGAETTKVIGVVRNADGSGNLLTSTGNALDINIKSGNPTTMAVTQSTSPWIIAGAAASGASKSGNPVQIGGVFNTTQPTVTTGQAVEAQTTARGAIIVGTGVDTFNVTVNAALPAGTNLLGKAGIDQTTPGTTNAVSLAQIGVTTVSTGNGVVGAGVQRVAIASDNTAFSVNATLSAETTKVIGTVNQGTSPWVVSGTVTANAGTNLNTSTLALESGGNLATVAGAIISQEATTSGVKGLTVFGAVTTNAPSYTTAKSDALSLDTSGLLRISLKDTPANTTALKVDGSAVTQPISGTVTVAQNTASNLNAVVVGGKTNNNAVPGATNVGALTAVATASAPSYTEGNLAALSTDLSGALRISGSISVGGTTDNSAFTAGTSTGTPAFAFYHSTIDTVTDGRAAALSIDSKRNLFTVLRDAAGNARGVNVTASNALTVDGSAVTQPVSGTVTANAGTGTFGTNTAQINGVTPLMGNGVTGTGSQRVTISSDNTAFTVNPASATAPVSTMNSASANAGVTSPLAAVFDDASPTAITENSFGFVRMSANRNLYGTIRDAAGNERGANVNASNQLSVSIDAASASNISTNIAQMNGVAVTMGNGASGTGVQRVTIANDSTGIVALPAAGTSVVGSKAAGTAAATSVLEGAVYNATTPVLTDGQQAASQADTAGSLQVNTEGKKATYSSAPSTVLAAAATDALTITGSATKTIRITRVSFTGIGTTLGDATVTLNKRSTANTGGTSTAAAAVPHDSTSASATATVLQYTANPTLGTLVGAVRSLPSPFFALTNAAYPTVWDFTTRNGQGIVLRGTSQVLAIGLGGATVTGGLLYGEIEWTEE